MNKLRSNKNIIILAILISGVFLFLRVFGITHSLWFFNDIGRDFWVLFQWFAYHKLPLLGPQTSALPFNQSAVYFYLLAPIHYLSGQSVYSSLITLLLFYLTIFWVGIKLLWPNKNSLSKLLMIAWLLTIHPQMITQNRFVWNPSFIAPLIILAYWCWDKLEQSWSKKTLTVFALSLGLATALNYSVVPVVLSLMLLSIWRFRRQWHFLHIFVAGGIGIAFWQLPTIAFELRHQFFLTKLLLFGEKLSQGDTSIAAKITQLQAGLMAGIPNPIQLFLTLLIIAAVLWSLLLVKKSRDDAPASRTQLFWITATLILAVLTNLITPIGIAPHYVFGLLSLWILMLAHLEKKAQWLIIIALSALWLRPSVVTQYFAPAPHPVKELEQCAQIICAHQTQPTFVSIQSDHHPYHNAMEWKFLLAKSGCTIKELDTQIDQASQMIVIVDHSIYEQGKTAYNELTQFGPAKEIARLSCQNNLEAVFLLQL